MNAFANTREKYIDYEFIRWSSVAAGVVVASIIGVLVNLLGTAIGFSVFSHSNTVIRPLGFGTVAWLILSTTAAMYSGGWVASHFSDADSTETGIMHGAMVSGISILLSLFIMASAAGAIFSNSFSVLNQAISMSASMAKDGASMVGKALKGAAQLSPDISNKVKKAIPDLQPLIDKINEKANDFINKNVDPSNRVAGEIAPEKIKAKLEKQIVKYLNTIGEDNVAESRNELVKSFVELTGKTPEEINQAIDEWQAVYKDAKEKALQATRDVSKEIASILSQVALMNFLILLCGVIAGAVGGACGLKED